VCAPVPGHLPSGAKKGAPREGRPNKKQRGQILCKEGSFKSAQ